MCKVSRGPRRLLGACDSHRCSPKRTSPWTPHCLLPTSPQIVVFKPLRSTSATTSHTPAFQETPAHWTVPCALQSPRLGGRGSCVTSPCVCLPRSLHLRPLHPIRAPVLHAESISITAATPSPREMPAFTAAHVRTPLLLWVTRVSHNRPSGSSSNPFAPVHLGGRQFTAIPRPRVSQGIISSRHALGRCSVTSSAFK